MHRLIDISHIISKGLNLTRLIDS